MTHSPSEQGELQKLNTANTYSGPIDQLDDAQLAFAWLESLLNRGNPRLREGLSAIEFDLLDAPRARYSFDPRRAQQLFRAGPIDNPALILRSTRRGLAELLLGRHPSPENSAHGPWSFDGNSEALDRLLQVVTLGAQSAESLLSIRGGKKSRAHTRRGA
jgi:hypothetical protein